MVGGRHLVGVAVALHRVEAAMGDRAAGFVVFDIAHHVEGGAVEEFGPVGMRHRAGDLSRPRQLRENIRKIKAMYIGMGCIPLTQVSPESCRFGPGFSAP